MCSQALAEAERRLPDVVSGLEDALKSRSLQRRPLQLRMTGCPNGCARPALAEVGVVGRTKSTYDVYVGGGPSGTRLASIYREKVKLEDIPEVLSLLLDRWPKPGRAGRGVGRICGSGGRSTTVYLKGRTRRGRLADRSRSPSCSPVPTPVVRDRLIDTSILEYINPRAAIFDVGKGPGDSSTQSSINDLLIELSANFDTVIRLEGRRSFCLWARRRRDAGAAPLREWFVRWYPD